MKLLQYRCIRICFHFDDFEISNPIGAHKKVYKLSAFYYTINNLNNSSSTPEIYLRGLCYNENLKKFTMNRIESFVREMKWLQNGLPGMIQGNTLNLKFRLVNVIGKYVCMITFFTGDNLGIHELFRIQSPAAIVHSAKYVG